jgi:hypothetical protein
MFTAIRGRSRGREVETGRARRFELVEAIFARVRDGAFGAVLRRYVVGNTLLEQFVMEQVERGAQDWILPTRRREFPTCARQDSNLRPLAPEASALSTELRALMPANRHFVVLRRPLR